MRAARSSLRWWLASELLKSSLLAMSLTAMGVSRHQIKLTDTTSVNLSYLLAFSDLIETW
jgi:hypothetical protein